MKYFMWLFVLVFELNNQKLTNNEKSVFNYVNEIYLTYYKSCLQTSIGLVKCYFKCQNSIIYFLLNLRNAKTKATVSF